MEITYYPVLFVDVTGSVLMILLSFLCLKKALSLRSKESENVILSYLVWVCYGLVIFAVSRSAGHILKQALVINGYLEIWNDIRPFSGSVNTFAFILVGSITIFFRQIWKIYMQVVHDKKELEITHSKLISLNQNLEQRVAERTEKLRKEAEQRTLLEKQMAQAEKLAATGELSAGVAHEINNPLGIILGYNQLLLRSEKDPQKYEDLKIIEKHVKHCKVIVEDLLSFSRSSKPKKKLYNIHEILDDVVSFVKSHTAFNNTDIIKRYSDNIPEICIDAEKIKQVFINLIMNANHAMNFNGNLYIKTSLENEKIKIDLEDTGEGIEKENLSRIFDPFFTTKPTGKGTGLGLSVSYGIVKNHGGDITVTSVKNSGTTFSIYLPADNTCITGDQNE
ncbi:MAG: sensor histidine kinase [Thermodesulfobacteriota bacterium]